MPIGTPLALLDARPLFQFRFDLDFFFEDFLSQELHLDAF